MFEPIEKAPKDGTPIMISRSDRPDWGEHLMGWDKRRKVWIGAAFAMARRVETKWDETLPQPDQWRLA